MKIQNELKWLCENSKRLENCSGQWVLFSVHEGLVSNGKSLDAVLRAAKKTKLSEDPFILHVPSKNDLKYPFPQLKDK